ncbi:MAG: hypothetical protein FJX54_05925 [Alphaproteobacteria bacterium]|nr:hypothetical protein [Alphaproteobacteria bacterium]
MLSATAFSLAAVAALVPAAVAGWRGRGADSVYWAALAFAVIGPGAWALAQIENAWHAGLSVALWVTIAASMAFFAVLAAAAREVWRLSTLLAPYLVVLGLLATVWQGAPEPRVPGPYSSWVLLHIVVSVATYALVTVAGIAGLAVALQERALKTKQPSRLTRLLPSVAEAEGLEVGLLAAAEAVLGLGVLTGAAAHYLATGKLVAFDHKTVLSLAAFLVIGLLLIAHRRVGLRGRRAARVALFAWLLLTLAYPGVKFVTSVLLTDRVAMQQMPCIPNLPALA